MRKVDVPVGANHRNPSCQSFSNAWQLLGMVQNMSVFICPKCNHSTHIFGSEGVAHACSKHDVPFLGDIPLHASICDDADRGKPTVVAEPASGRAQAFMAIADRIAKDVKL